MSSVALPLKHCISLQSNTIAGVRACVFVHVHVLLFSLGHCTVLLKVDAF